MRRRIFVISFCVVMLFSGCGSVRTLGPGAEEALIKQSQSRKTRCHTIPRTYSGVAYVICMSYKVKEDEETGKSVDSPGAETSQGTIKDNKSLPGSNLIDLFLSGVVDTIVLPYTLFMQWFGGSYKLEPGTPVEEVPRKDY